MERRNGRKTRLIAWIAAVVFGGSLGLALITSVVRLTAE
jgi:hypothetical protein